MKNISTKILPVALLLQLFSTNLKAQKNDKALLGEFIQVCNVYKQLPLYLNVRIINSSNVANSEDDTLSSEAEFFIKGSNSYVRLGELEQMVNDSMALLISHKLGRMILYPEAGPVITRLKAMTSTPLQGSSEAELAKKYKAEKKADEKGLELITIESKELVHGTSLAKESIEMRYDPRTKTPVRITTTRRNLLLLDQTDYENLKGQPVYAEKLLKTENNEYYLVKEQTAAFIYKTISHENIQVPATISDRVSRNKEGNFAPVKGYENYLLTVN